MRDTMTQYQNVYDAFMRCDTDKLAEELPDMASNIVLLVSCGK